MFTNNPVAFFVQGLVAVIIIGGFYSFYVSSRVYGGLIGKAIRYLGIGMLFVIISVIERILINFGLLPLTVRLSLGEDILSFLGILFLGIGFYKLNAAAKV